MNKDDILNGPRCCFEDKSYENCSYNTPDGHSGEGDFCIDLLGQDALKLLSDD